MPNKTVAAIRWIVLVPFTFIAGGLASSIAGSVVALPWTAEPDPPLLVWGHGRLVCPCGGLYGAWIAPSSKGVTWIMLMFVQLLVGVIFSFSTPSSQGEVAIIDGMAYTSAACIFAAWITGKTKQ